jgi:hypothetical protein
MGSVLDKYVRPYLKIKQKIKGRGCGSSGRAPPSKLKTLSSNSCSTRKKKKRRKKEQTAHMENKKEKMIRGLVQTNNYLFHSRS